MNNFAILINAEMTLLHGDTLKITMKEIDCYFAFVSKDHFKTKSDTVKGHRSKITRCPERRKIQKLSQRMATK